MLATVQSLMIAGALAAGGAAQAAPEDDAPRCVSVRGINGYTVLDDQHLLLRGGASRFYLVSTRTRCSGMSAGAEVGLSFGDTARICRPIVEYVIPEDGWRCAIESILEVDSEEAARALAAQDSDAES